MHIFILCQTLDSLLYRLRKTHLHCFGSTQNSLVSPTFYLHSIQLSGTRLFVTMTLSRSRYSLQQLLLQKIFLVVQSICPVGCLFHEKNIQVFSHSFSLFFGVLNSNLKFVATYEYGITTKIV